MNNKRYMIGCGWFHSSKTPEAERKKQAKRWIENIRRFASPKPECICVVGQGGCRFPESGVESVTVSGDLGNHNDLIKGIKNNEFNGWSGAVLALAMLAYNNESDLIFQEQDCLAFGNYVDEMYRQIGSRGMIFGRRHRGEPNQACSQSLFLIRHFYLRTFVTKYFGSHPQTSNAHTGEPKFEWLRRTDSDMVGRFRFGYDRERPFNIKDRVFYAQQTSEEDLRVLKESGLI